VIDESRWRTLMGHWATGVSVVTSVGPRGLTANALTSLSLEPPLLLVCFAYESNTFESVRGSHRFAVNILASGQEEVARRFALKAQDEKWSDLPFTLVQDVPVLNGSLAWVVCDVEQELHGGDHAIVIGRPLEGNVAEGLEPLLYYGGSYRH
jgi:3-hydroxy-9,10-secoandrosta-1,3,5(10)-triene-9,17-dione monooxygenase reductase component